MCCSILIYFQLKSKIKKSKSATAELTQPLSEDEDDDEEPVVQKDATTEKDKEPGDVEQALPNIAVPRSVRDPRTRAETVTSQSTMVTTSVTTPITRHGAIDQSLLRLLAERAVDSEQLKRKLEDVLAEGDRPLHAEKLYFGQWVAACTMQISDHDWAEYTDILQRTLRRFVPRMSGRGIQPLQPLAQTTAPTFIYGPHSTPTTASHQGQYGQSYGSGPMSTQAHSGSAIGQYSQQAGQSQNTGASFTGYQSTFGGSGGQYTESASSQGCSQPSVRPVTPAAGTFLDISYPHVPSADNSGGISGGMYPNLSPFAFMSDSVNVLNPPISNAPTPPNTSTSGGSSAQ